MINDVEHFHCCSLAIWIFSFVKFLILLPFLKKLCFLSYSYWCVRVLYIFGKWVLWQIYILQYLLPLCGLSFCSFKSVFWWMEFILLRSNLSVFSFNFSCLIWYLCLPQGKYTLLCFPLEALLFSMIHLKLLFCTWEVEIKILFFHWSSPFVKPFFPYWTAVN